MSLLVPHPDLPPVVEFLCHTGALVRVPTVVVVRPMWRYRNVDTGQVVKLDDRSGRLDALAKWVRSEIPADDPMVAARRQWQASVVLTMWDGRNHRISTSGAGWAQMLTVCGRRACPAPHSGREVPGRAPVDCQSCLDSGPVAADVVARGDTSLNPERKV